MKEVTVWDGKPRCMWCWDNDVERKEKELVICILTYEQMKELDIEEYPVCGRCCNYKHCAEIEETKRPCTMEELLKMLKKQGLPFVQKRYLNEDPADICYTLAISSMTKNTVTLENGECHGYGYLCEHYTLLDGADLWVVEEQNEE